MTQFLQAIGKFIWSQHTLLKTSFLLCEILIRFDEWNAKHKRKVNSQALFGFTRLSTVVC